MEWKKKKKQSANNRKGKGLFNFFVRMYVVHLCVGQTITDEGDFLTLNDE